MKLNKDIYEVGEDQATVTVTDGTGGYKTGAGKGVNKVSASFQERELISLQSVVNHPNR